MSTIVTRAGKGSPLTHAEVDANFTNLNADKLESGDNVSALTNDAGYTTNVGDITGVTAGAGISGGGTSGTVTVSHADTSTQASVNNSGATVIQDVTLDTYGHVTNLNSTTITLKPPTQTVFTSSGTWTKPSGCKTIKVTVTGGGGASGSTALNYSGGGAGGTAIEYINVTSVSSVSVTVGAGDTTRSPTPGSGGTSSFGSYCSGLGGGRYNSGGTWDIGRGGGATGGNYNLVGQDGCAYVNDSRAVNPNAASFTGGYGDGGGGGQVGTSGIVIVEEYY